MHNTHQGEAVRRKVKEMGMTVTDFAKAIPRGRRGVYHIFKRKKIDEALLKEISQVLNYNFIAQTDETNTSAEIHLVIIEADEEQLQEVMSKFTVVYSHKCEK
jgi:uncharacterized protein YebE (UPF0316 family)